MADHLGEGEEGLGDGDVAPDRLRQLVAAARPLGDQPVDLLLAPLVLGQPLVDQGDVVGDRLAVAGEDDLGRHLPRLLHRLDVGDERLRPPLGAVERPEISGLEEMWGSRWSAAIRILRSASQKSVSEGLWPGRCSTRRVRSRKCIVLAVARAAWSPPRASPSRGSCGRRCAAPPSPPRECRCAASARPRSRPRPRRPRRSWRAARRRSPSAATSAPECSATISTRPRWSMCWWVTITSSRSSIEWPRSPSWALELVQCLARVGPGVDQGQRLVLDQVAVDPPNREGRGDAQAVDARPAPPAPAPALG